MANDPIRNNTFDGHVVGEGLAFSCRIVGEIRLENHVGARGSQRSKEPDEVPLVLHEKGVAAALGRTWLQNRGPADLRLSGDQARLGLIRRNREGSWHRKASILQSLPLDSLVGQRNGRGDGVKGKTERLGDVRER